MAEDSSYVKFAGLCEDNIAGGHGGAVAVLAAASIVLESGAVFKKNRAMGSGGCAYFVGGTVVVGKWRLLLHVARKILGTINICPVQRAMSLSSHARLAWTGAQYIRLQTSFSAS